MTNTHSKAIFRKIITKMSPARFLWWFQKNRRRIAVVKTHISSSGTLFLTSCLYIYIYIYIYYFSFNNLLFVLPHFFFLSFKHDT